MLDLSQAKIREPLRPAPLRQDGAFQEGNAPYRAKRMAAYMVNGVKFDAFVGGRLIDAKSSMAWAVGKDGAFKSWFWGGQGMVSQARRQLTAAQGRSVVWRIQDSKTAGAIRQLFDDRGINGIKVEVAKTVCTGSRIAREGPC